MAPTVPIEYTGQRESKLFSTKGEAGKIMGKSRKISKGYSSGFVPDYRHVVETVAESGGFGSSGRVDTEMTASEDSYAPKRKSFKLNDREGYDGFNVPIQILSLSKMSCTERKDLERRLSNELEQVRILQRRITAVSSNSLLHSPVSDIRSFTDGQKGPPMQMYQRPVKEVPTAPGKKKTPPVKNGPRTKGAGAKRSESVKQTLTSNPNNFMLAKQCETLLTRMMHHEYGWVFNEPVDIVKLNIPDYFNIIKHPMDFGTIKSKLLSGEYSDLLGFASDVRLTFTNAMTFNPPGNNVHFMAKTLNKFFEMRWKPIEKKISATAQGFLPSNSSVVIDTETAIITPPKKSKNAPIENTVKSENKVKHENVKQVMSEVDKHRLIADLEPLLTDLPDHIIHVLKESSLNAGQDGEDEIEIDLDALDDNTLFTLRKLLDDYLLDKQKNQAKDPQPVELDTKLGLSDSFLQKPQKGNAPADEDVDIGGNDPPLSSFPPVKIEKDAVRRNTECSSSSSSSSDSDSDSGSSSSGDSDAAEDPSKDNLGPRGNLEPKRSDLNTGDPETDLAGQNQQSILAPVETGCIQDEADESAPQERQVSPEKLYRAALLRSRFADTIIKAQEKTLEKGEKLDPEKLRMEREDLERRRKEEKARLQAEAKAAEDARKKAEAEAAAEARRKRELEREAARQALQQMEKTVDINENSQFMEDLEMFRSGPDEQLPNFIEETSPEHSQNGLGSFKFQGSSNPLEQLGLFMKKDDGDDDDGDDDDDEPDARSVPDASNDPEEGEID